jgi:DNA (cytosine-5)-methyltransferase 1
VADPGEITVLSLCAGYGGLEMGLALALENPLRVVAVEIEAYALANLVAKAEEGKLAIEALWPDLRTFPAERFRGCFDFVLAGYPCQKYSLANCRTEIRRQSLDLWPQVRRVIGAVRPGFVFLENVPQHLYRGFDTVARDLEEMDFVTACGLFEASETGATIRSRRLFILAKAVCDRHGNTKAKIQARRTTIELCVPEVGPPGPSQVGKIPRMADDGPYRVDRLRLLGNGVVPQQAARAIRELSTQGREHGILKGI